MKIKSSIVPQHALLPSLCWDLAFTVSLFSNQPSLLPSPLIYPHTINLAGVSHLSWSSVYLWPVCIIKLPQFLKECTLNQNKLSWMLQKQFFYANEFKINNYWHLMVLLSKNITFQPITQEILFKPYSWEIVQNSENCIKLISSFSMMKL